MAIAKNLKRLSLIILAGLLLEGGGYFYGIRFSEIFYFHTQFNEEQKTLEKKTGISFNNNLLKEDYPHFWRESGVKNTEIIGLSEKYEFLRFFNITKKEIEKIPVNILKSNLKEIYGVSSIFFDGIFSGGTYAPKQGKVFIALHTDYGNPIPRRFIKNIFHHEFSSILLKNYNFEEKKWLNQSPQDFIYKAEEDPFYYVNVMQGDADKISDEELYSRGLLKQYAETGLENDFNTYAEVIFTEPHKMKKLIAEYPVIKHKYEAFKAFYLDIDAGFSPVFDKIDG